MDRHNSAESAKVAVVSDSESAHTITTIRGKSAKASVVSDEESFHTTATVQEEYDDIRKFLTSLFQDSDLNLRNFVLNMPKNIVNFYNKVIFEGA